MQPRRIGGPLMSALLKSPGSTILPGLTRLNYLLGRKQGRRGLKKRILRSNGPFALPHLPVHRCRCVTDWLVTKCLKAVLLGRLSCVVTTRLLWPFGSPLC